MMVGNVVQLILYSCSVVKPSTCFFGHVVYNFMFLYCPCEVRGGGGGSPLDILCYSNYDYYGVTSARGL